MSYVMGQNKVYPKLTSGIAG